MVHLRFTSITIVNINVFFCDDSVHIFDDNQSTAPQPHSRDLGTFCNDRQPSSLGLQSLFLLSSARAIIVIIVSIIKIIVSTFTIM